MDFMKLEDYIQDTLCDRYHNPHENELCECGRGKKLVRCRYDGCFQYPTSCASCWISAHRYNPFHWALEWNEEKKIWVQRDFSEVSPDCDIQLGHIIDKERCSGTKDSMPFIVTHVNGIHKTRIRFCGCPYSPDKHTQLIQSQLFPATTESPRSAFTFAALKHFNMHNLQSKCGAFDYILSLRRLTDNVITVNVPVSFRISMSDGFTHVHGK